MTEQEGTRKRLADLSERAVDLVEARPLEARALAEEALELASALGESTAEAACRYVLGAARMHGSDYASAETELRRGLDLAQASDDKALMVRILRVLLKCAFFMRNADAALLRGLQALKIARDLGDRRAEALTHNDLGLVYGNVGDFEGALEHLLAGLRILREEGTPKLASLLNNIGNVYLELGDDREALQFFESAEEAFREENNARGEAIALGNIGRASAALRKPDKALVAFEKSLNSFDSQTDAPYRPPALARLATALAALSRFDEADAAFDEAFALLESSPHREFEDEILLSAARYHLSRDNAPRGIELLNRMLDLLPGGETTKRSYELHAALAEAYERLGDSPTALRHSKRYHLVRQAVSDSATAVRIRGLMLQFDVEQARQQEEIFRLRNVELASVNKELQALQRELEERNQELYQISVHDPLTGLHNRRYLEEHLAIELGRAARYGRPLCAVICDIDHFKVINDEFSHGIGDEVLRRIGAIFRETVRISDIATRYGGEEFLLILPDTDIPGAEFLAQRLRSAVARHPWAEVGADLMVTLSIGLAKLEAGGTKETLIAAADSRLYEAKRAGRDQIMA